MLFAALMIACSTSDSAGKDYSSGDATAGESIFSANCASCHGTDATGGSGPDLTEPFTNDADADLANTILNGVSGTDMAAYSGVLSDTDVADVIAYIHSIVG